MTKEDLGEVPKGLAYTGQQEAARLLTLRLHTHGQRAHMQDDPIA